MTPLLLGLIFSKMSKDTPFIARPLVRVIVKEIEKVLIKPNLEANFKLMEGHLAKNSFFAGKSLTGADIQMGFIVEAGEARLGYGSYPSLQKYLNKIRKRPAYQKAIEIGSPVIGDLG